MIDYSDCTISMISGVYLNEPIQITLVNVYVDLLVFTRIAGSS